MEFRKKQPEMQGRGEEGRAREGREERSLEECQVRMQIQIYHRSRAVVFHKSKVSV